MAQNKYVIGHATALSGVQWDSVLRIASASLDPAKTEDSLYEILPSYYPAVAAGRVKAPTPTVQGATDRQVPADQADKLAMTPRSERSWRTP